MIRDDPRYALPIPARLRARMRDAWQGSVTRRMARPASIPDSLAYRPVPLAVGSQDVADAMLRGHFELAGSSAKIERGDPWRAAAPSADWASALHGFGWLSHFSAGDGPASRTAARRFVDGWLTRHGKRGGLAWRPAITGQRVTAWLMNAPLLTENAEPLYRSELLKSIAAQGRYLSRTAESEPRPESRMRAATGMLYAGLCLPDERKLMTEGLKLFLKAVAASSLPDGGPLSRNPSDLLERLQLLVQVRADLTGAGEAALAEGLDPLIARAAPALRALRHGDGGLALFHGSRAETAEAIDRALVAGGEASPAAGHLPETGYLRLAAGRMTALMDAGDPPGGAHARTAHDAPLALEVSVGGERLIVNCGSAVHLGAEWEAACRSTDAHSALTLAGDGPGRLQGTDRTRWRRLTNGAHVSEQDRAEDEEGIWALAAHDGYADRFGLLHYRRLFLSANGTDLRGEDTLSLVKGGAKTLERARARRKSPDGPAFTLRFHLHPSVEAEGGGKDVTLTLPSGERWQMRQSGGSFALEESIYVPGLDPARQSLQIVLTARLEDDSGQVRWALRRGDGS